MDNQTSNSAVLILDVQEPRLDAANAQAFRERIGIEIDRGHGRIVLNMKAVNFVDSSGIGVLVGHFKRAGSRGDLVLAALTPTVEKVFKLTRMDRIFAIFPDPAAAISHMASR